MQTEELMVNDICTDDLCGAVVQMDGDGIVTYWNNSAEEILGYTSEEIIGVSGFETIFLYDALEGNSVRNVYATGDVSYSFQSQALSKDGTTHPVALVASPIYNESGGIDGVTVMMTSILLGF